MILVAGLVLPAMATRIDLGARQTSPADRLPAAKLPPAPAPTEPPSRLRWGAVSLFQRAGGDAGINTCGWVDSTRESSLSAFPSPGLALSLACYFRY